MCGRREDKVCSAAGRPGMERGRRGARQRCGRRRPPGGVREEGTYLRGRPLAAGRGSSCRTYRKSVRAAGPWPCPPAERWPGWPARTRSRPGPRAGPASCRPARGSAAPGSGARARRPSPGGAGSPLPPPPPYSRGSPGRDRRPGRPLPNSTPPPAPRDRTRAGSSDARPPGPAVPPPRPALPSPLVGTGAPEAESAARPEPGNLLEVWGSGGPLLAAAAARATPPGSAHTPPLAPGRMGGGDVGRDSGSLKGEPLQRRPLSGEGRPTEASTRGGRRRPGLALPWHLLQLLAIP